MAQLTDGSNTLKVVGPDRVTIENVKTVMEPASTPAVVEWPGIEVVTGDLHDATDEAPGYVTGATAVAPHSATFEAVVLAMNEVAQFRGASISPMSEMVPINPQMYVERSNG